jgi:hypothetical protein
VVVVLTPVRGELKRTPASDWAETMEAAKARIAAETNFMVASVGKKRYGGTGACDEKYWC